MNRRTRTVNVDVDVDISVLEFTEDEIKDLKIAALRIVRICQLVPQEFDRKAVIDEANAILKVLEP